MKHVCRKTHSQKDFGWFAPWTWKRRTLCAIAAVTLVGAYVESPVMLGARFKPPEGWDGAVLMRFPILSFPSPLFDPLAYCYEHSLACQHFYHVQAEALMPNAHYVR